MIIVNKTFDDGAMHNFWTEMNQVIHKFPDSVHHVIFNQYMDCLSKSFVSGKLDIIFTLKEKNQYILSLKHTGSSLLITMKELYSFFSCLAGTALFGECGLTNISDLDLLNKNHIEMAFVKSGDKWKVSMETH